MPNIELLNAQGAPIKMTTLVAVDVTTGLGLCFEMVAGAETLQANDPATNWGDQ